MPSCAGTVHAARGLWIHDFVIRTTSATSLITLSSKASVLSNSSMQFVSRHRLKKSWKEIDGMEWMGTGLTVKPARCQFGRVSGVLCGAESVVVAPHTTVVLSMPWRRTRKSVICISCVCGLFFSPLKRQERSSGSVGSRGSLNIDKKTLEAKGGPDAW